MLAVLSAQSGEGVTQPRVFSGVGCVAQPRVAVRRRPTGERANELATVRGLTVVVLVAVPQVALCDHPGCSSRRLVVSTGKSRPPLRRVTGLSARL